MSRNIAANSAISSADERVRTGSTSSKKAPRKAFSLVGSLAAHAVMIITVLICILPMLIIISTSFKLPNEVFDLKLIPANPTLSNYGYVLSGGFVEWLMNSLKIGAMTTIVGMALATILG